MARKEVVDPATGESVPKFSWKRLSRSIVREMYNRAVKAAEITSLSTEQRMGLMDRIGKWAAGKIVDAVARRVRRVRRSE